MTGSAGSRTFTYVGGRSNKWWRIEPVSHQQFSDRWCVRVTFGRIGTAGQSLTKVFDAAWAATHYYNSKVNEKLEKGYHEQAGPGAAIASTPVQKIAAAPKVKEKCKHDSLGRVGGYTWKCNVCGEKVEFDKAEDTINITPAKVRRFIDLDELRGGE